MQKWEEKRYMIQITDLLFSFLMLVLFLLVIIGTLLKWNILVDPPDSWTWYSQTILKKAFGEDFLVGFNYLVGILGTGISGYIFIVLLKAYFQQS